MTGRSLDAIERGELCNLMIELGPEAATLLEPWTTHDLAAHLVLREHDYGAAPGLVVPGAWARFAERRRKALTRRDYATLLRTIRSGPPHGFFRIGWVRRGPNLNEFFVHHEDVRRANGLDPRTNAAALDDALLAQCRLRGVVPRTTTARRRARPRVGGDDPDPASASRNADCAPPRTAGRAVAVPLRPSGRGQSRSQRR